MKTITLFSLIFVTYCQVESAPQLSAILGPIIKTVKKNAVAESARVEFTATCGDEQYPATVVVDETNAEDFGLPIGTELELDEGTGRYRPPPLSENFTADDRIHLIWDNKRARPNFCMVSPGKLAWSGVTYDYHVHRYCTDNDDKNICCDGKTCDCTLRQFNCECV